MRVHTCSVCPTLCHLWIVPCQATRSMGFPRQGYWSGLPFPSPGDLPDPGIKPWSPSLQADSLLSEPLGEPKKFVLYYLSILCPWNSPSKNTRVGSCSLLQGIFPTQGSKPSTKIKLYLKLKNRISEPPRPGPGAPLPEP